VEVALAGGPKTQVVVTVKLGTNPSTSTGTGAGGAGSTGSTGGAGGAGGGK